jgi:hypothetical protein
MSGAFGFALRCKISRRIRSVRIEMFIELIARLAPISFRSVTNG